MKHNKVQPSRCSCAQRARIVGVVLCTVSVCFLVVLMLEYPEVLQPYQDMATHVRIRAQVTGRPRSRALESSEPGVPGYEVLGAVDPNPLKWPGGFHAVRLDTQGQSSTAQQQSAAAGGMSCYQLAVQVPQPMTALYTRQRAPPWPLQGDVPRAFYLWDGNITRAEFDAVPAELPRGPDCVHCGHAVRYQVVSGHLFRRGGLPNWIVETGEEVLLVALHLFTLPDMDFIVHYDDSCPPGGVPVLSWNICRHKARAGFTFPSYTAWKHALGPEQLTVYQQCLSNRYPQSRREGKVLWRGSTTDPIYPSFTINMVHKVTRMNIHKQFAGDPLVDAQVTKVLFADKCTEEYLAPLAPPLPLEGYNRAAVIMDVDGNGWSDRLSRIIHFPTPILKQATNHTAFFEHLLAPGHTLEYYENNLSDLRERAYTLIEEWQRTPGRLQEQTRQRQALAKVMMNTVSVAEAAAYSLLQYHSKSTWQFTRDPTYEYVPFSKVCVHNRHLPAELCQRIRARPGP